MKTLTNQIRKTVTEITAGLASSSYDSPELCKTNRGIRLDQKAPKPRPKGICAQEKAWKQLLASTSVEATPEPQEEMSLVDEDGFDPYNNYNNDRVRSNLS